MKFTKRFKVVLPAALAVLALGVASSPPANAQLSFVQQTGICGGPNCSPGFIPTLEALGGGHP